MKRLETMQVSPHLNNKNIRAQMKDINKYKKTIQGTSNRHIDITPLIDRNKVRKDQYS